MTFRKDPEEWENRKMTEESVGGDFSLKTLNKVNLVNMYRDYGVFFAHWIAINRLGKLEYALTLRKQEEYHEDMGSCCVWFYDDKLEQPPCYVGSMLDSEFPFEDAKYFIQIPMIFKK